MPELHNTNAVVQHPNSLLDFLPLDPAHLSIFHTYFLFLVVLYLLRFASDRESCFHTGKGREGLGLGAWATCPMLGHADSLVTTRHWLYWPGWKETSLAPFAKHHQDGEQGERTALGGMHLVVKCLLPSQMQVLMDLQGHRQAQLLPGTQQHSCALQQWCAFFFLLLICLLPYLSLMIPTEKSYHSSVKEQLYINQGSWKKSKRGRRICQCRQTHFCGGR